MATAILSISVILQLVNVWLALRLIPLTGRRVVWSLLAIALFLMAARRIVTMGQIVMGGRAPEPLLAQELLTLTVSIAFLAGLTLVRPLLQALQDAELLGRKSVEQYRVMIDSSPMAVVVCNGGKVNFANRSALAIFDFQNIAEILDRPFAELCAPAARPTILKRFASINAGEPTQPFFEAQIPVKSGGSRDVEILVASFIWAGHVAEYVVLQDVSDRKQREETLRAREAELAHVMRLHTMGEVAAELAHEINQPLYAISNFAQAGKLHLQSDDPENRAQVEYCLEQAASQAERAAQIVRNLRRFVTKSSDELQVVSLNELIGDAVNLVAAEARRYRTAVELDLDPANPMVRADAVQIQQVVVNLLVNAFEAMGDLPPTLRRVQLTSLAEATHVEVSVADRGPGMDEAELTRVFEPFVTTKPQGMGMGLAVSRTILTNHGGKIWAVQNAHGGTTFRFALPRACCQ